MDRGKEPDVREPIVLFPKRLGAVISGDHGVRLVYDILSRLDWSK